jgi:hypothetical protein
MPAPLFRVSVLTGRRSWQSDTIAADDRQRAGRDFRRTSSCVKEINDMVAAGRAGGHQRPEFL